MAKRKKKFLSKIKVKFQDFSINRFVVAGFSLAGIIYGFQVADAKTLLSCLLMSIFSAFKLEIFDNRKTESSTGETNSEVNDAAASDENKEDLEESDVVDELEEELEEKDSAVEKIEKVIEDEANYETTNS